MVKKLLSIAALALPLFAANAQETVEKVVFEEDFSLMTTGEVGNPDTETAIVEDGAIKPEYTHKPGWTAASAQSAGGSIRLGTGVYLYSPVLALSASVDGEITVEFDVYAENTAGRGGDFVYIQQVMGSEQNQISHMFVAEEWTHVVFSTNKDKTCEPNKNFASIPSNGVMQLGFKSAWNAIYIKNVKVTINVDPNAEVAESADFTGTYTFKATKTITAPNAGEAKAVWLQDNFEFTIDANEGDDAEAYPFLLNNFPMSIKEDGTVLTYNAIKAKPSADGKSLVLTIRHAGKLLNGSDHIELAGPGGYEDTATELVISPVEGTNNFTIEGGFQVINHTEAFAIFPESWRNLAKFTDVVIAPAVPDFTGAYKFTSTKTITASNQGEAKALWVQNEFDFTITANEGGDAEIYPFLLNNFPVSIKDDGTVLTYNAVKAKPSADGNSLVLTIGHAGKLQNGGDHIELAGPAGCEDTATELVMSPIADSENYTIEGGFQVINHTEAFAIFPESKRNLAKFTDIVITRVGDVDGIDEIVVDEVEEAEKIAPAGVYTINGVKIRNTNDATDLHPGFYIIGGKKVVIR